MRQSYEESREANRLSARRRRAAERARLNATELPRIDDELLKKITHEHAVLTEAEELRLADQIAAGRRELILRRSEADREFQLTREAGCLLGDD